jgi:hypothetical protein
MTPTRHLTLIQRVCLVFVSVCVLVAYLTAYREKSSASMAIQSAIVALGASSAVGGFTFQRKLLKKRESVQPWGKSDAVGRWQAGHIARLWSAVAVVVWGLVLWELGGSHVAAKVLFALGILLLLIWSPGVAPAEDPPTRSAPAH